jgi:hypothetical protein
MKMPHLGRLRFKTTHAFLKVAVSSRQSLVLSQVLRPRFDDERFDVVRGMLAPLFPLFKLDSFLRQANCHVKGLTGSINQYRFS